MMINQEVVDKQLDTGRLSHSTVNPYTDSPNLSDTPWLISFQLLYWLFFKPSAWRNYVQRIAPDLRFDFRLSELSWAEWQNSGLRPLLLYGYAILPMVSVLLVWLIVQLLSFIGLDLLGMQSPSLAFVLMGGLGFSLACGFAFGMVSGTAVGIASTALFAFAGSLVLAWQLNHASVAILCFMFGVVGNLIITLFPERPTSFTHLLGGILLGIVIGLIGVGALVGISYVIIELMGQPAAIATLTLFSALTVIAVSWPLKNYGLYVPIAIFAIVYGTIAFTVEGVFGGLAKGLVYGTLMGACLAMPYGATHHFLAKDDRGFAAGITGALGVSILLGLLGLFLDNSADNLTDISVLSILPVLGIGIGCALLGLTLNLWRTVLFLPLLLAWHFFIYSFDKRRTDNTVSHLHWHAVFWDEYHLKLGDLHDHLLLAMERDSRIGQKALDYLKTLKGHRQHWANIAQNVQIDMDSLLLEKFKTIEAIRTAYNELDAKMSEGSLWLVNFSQMSHAVNEALNYKAPYDKVTALNEVRNDLGSLTKEVQNTMSIAQTTQTWYDLVSKQVDMLQTEAKRQQQIKAPYVFAMPLNAGQKTFVGRGDLIKQLKDKLLSNGSSIFLYGQYRIGKTSLLKNLPVFLPDNIVALFVDLQGIVSIADNMKEFFGELAEKMEREAQDQYGLSLPSLSEDELSNNPIKGFKKWLEKILLAIESKTLLLMLDEFAKLDETVCKPQADYNKGKLDGAFRSWIQGYQNFQMLITSQSLAEVKRWDAIFNGTLVFEKIGYLTESSARQLIEQPLEDFLLRYESEATQRILDVTRCHPALVQLFCREIVDRKNEQSVDSRFLVRWQDVEEVLPKALSAGRFVFTSFENRVSKAGQAMLRYLATLGEGAVAKREELAQYCGDEDLDEALNWLETLELVESYEGGYRFKIMLFGHWFAKQHLV
jgi:AAA+ ATPase superfamily predicted ATPase